MTLVKITKAVEKGGHRVDSQVAVGKEGVGAGRALKLSHELDVFGLGPFLAFAFGEGDWLPIFQGTKTITDDIAEVDEQVGAVVAGDKAVAFAFIEPFNGSVHFV